MSTPKKVETVKKLSDKVKTARLLVLADYQGIKHKQLEDLRRILKKINAEFVVTKNTLLKKALAAQHKNISEEHLNGTLAAVFGFADQVAPVKELINFFKNTALGSVKAGLLDDQPISAEELHRLAKLPAKNILLGQLVGQLQAPVYGLHHALSWNLRKLVWTLAGVKSQKSS